MAKGFEAVEHLLDGLPGDEAKWIGGRVTRIAKMLDTRDEFPDMLFDGRPYDEQTAHLRLLQLHGDTVERCFSDAGRQALLDIAFSFAAENDLSPEVSEANWQKAWSER